MSQAAAQQRFAAALDTLVDHIKQDRSILAAILCGSLSHDLVWEKSDIDLMLVTIDDKLLKSSDVPLFADGVNVHANVIPRAEFRRVMEGSLRQSFIHALVAKGRLLYTHDETIGELCAHLQDIGTRDTDVQLLRAATHALPPIYKAHKFFVTRGDLEYTALWILSSATSLAQIEVVSHRLIADREVLPQAMTLNPSFFKRVYTDLLNARKTKAQVKAALDAIDGYIGDRATSLFAPILEYLRDVGEPRSARELEDHFKRHLDVVGVTTACEYLADQNLIGKASSPTRLTKKSNINVEELAFYAFEQ
jgi:hypothetical protein